MLLITEKTSDIRYIKEDTQGGGPKNYFIEGVFLQSDVKNRNGRIYPKKIVESEVNRYTKEYVKEDRALGELGHPEGPFLNLERVSHIIKDLRFEDTNVVGKAKILDTPYGKIVKNLIDEGAKLGVSSRGLGSVEKDDDGIHIVQDDFYLATIDIVADPSAPDAFVRSIVEGKSWVWDSKLFRENDLEKAKRAIKKTNKRLMEQAKLKIFASLLSKM